MSSVPGSVRVKSARKPLSKMQADQVLNVNDLLNFTLPPRQPPLASTPRRSRKVGHGVWNKERYVNAQFRFVMNPTGDYTAHFADPDIFFQWGDVLQVIIPRTPILSVTTNGEFPNQDDGFKSCPICLSPPTASRMTMCGHVFCYPCILHYLSTSENKWARCPICLDSVNERQLKSVRWFDGPESPSSSSDPLYDGLGVGSSLKLRLIQRPQISTLALPRSPTWPSEFLTPHQTPFHFLPDVDTFAKFMLATSDYLILHLTRELDELSIERSVLESDQDPLGVIFIDAAEARVKEQIAIASALNTPILKREVEKARGQQEEVKPSCSHSKGKIIAQSSRETEGVPAEFLSMNNNTALAINPLMQHARSQSRHQPRYRRNLNPPQPSACSYYFYQAASGLPIYLHPLDIKILLSHFCSYSSFPDTITVRVESVSLGSVNEDLRKRFKYLAHMAEGSDVAFIESDLEGVVDSERLKHFEVPLRMRAAKRKEKEKKEEKARSKAEEKEKEKLLISSSEWDGLSRTANTDGPTRENVDLYSPTSFPSASAAPSAGVWGTRSFASALHSPSVPSSSSNQRRPPNQEVETDWDIDAAWHELEQSNAGSRRKSAKKLVILGSGGERARRR